MISAASEYYANIKMGKCANKWVTNNKAINQHGWRLQKGITMRSSLVIICCCVVCSAFAIPSFTIITVFGRCEFICSGCCGHCFHANSFAISVCCVMLTTHKTAHVHTNSPFFHSLSLYLVCVFINRKIAFNWSDVQCSMFRHTHGPLFQVNLIRCTHRTDEYVK